MESLILIVLISIILRLANKAARPVTMCFDCALAHVETLSNGKRRVYCLFGGVMRPIRYVVTMCTGYRPRADMRRAMPIGFVPLRALTAGEEAATNPSPKAE